jgi:hypothetical protein
VPVLPAPLITAGESPMEVRPGMTVSFVGTVRSDASGVRVEVDAATLRAG